MSKIDSSVKLSKRVFSPKIEQALAFTFKAVGAKYEKDAVKTIKELVSQGFPDLDEKYIIQALKHGSLGHYGKTYKLCAQDVCIWICEYMKTNPEPDKDVWDRFNGKIRVAMEENKDYNWHQGKLHCMREKLIDDRIHVLETKFRFKEEKG